MLDFLKPKTHELQLTPSRELEESNGVYRSTGHQPLFEVTSTRKRLPKGWAEVKWSIKHHKNQIPPNPKFFFKVGSQETEPQVFSMPIQGENVQCMVQFPDNLSSLELTPSDAEGSFEVGKLEVTEIDRLQMFLSFAGKKVHKVARNPLILLKWATKLGLILSKGGTAELKEYVTAHQVAVDPENSTYQNWINYYDTLSQEDIDLIQKNIDTFSVLPRFQIFIKRNRSKKDADDTVKSIKEQLYSHVEFTFFDQTEELNQIFKDSQFDYFTVVQAGSKFNPTTFYHYAYQLNRNSDAQVIYSDEDTINEQGVRSNYICKPVWDPDFFHAKDYVLNSTVLKRDLVENETFEPGMKYQLILKASRTEKSIDHVPFILLHNKNAPHPTSYQTKNRALEAYFEKTDVKIEKGMREDSHHLSYPHNNPLISLIIPTRDHVEMVKDITDGILNQTNYKNVEVLITNNQSEKPETLEYFKEIQKDDRVRVVDYDHPFNYASMNNYAVSQARGEIIGLINNDIKVIHPEWLDEMVMHAVRPEIGAVGAKLYFGNDTIQHAGVVAGLGGVAGHAHVNQSRDYVGYLERTHLVQSLSAVTAACLLVKKSIFEEVAGLDGENLKIAFNDVDLCLKIQKAGYRNLWTPYAELYHLESVSRGPDNLPSTLPRFQRECLFMEKKWHTSVTYNDPYYSPNLTNCKHDNSLAYPPRVRKPWREFVKNP